MRILIYLLAMLTGFSAAEAARPVSATPTLVGATVGEAYAEASVKVSSRAQIAPSFALPATLLQSEPAERHATCLVACSTTPVLRHDINHS